MYVSEGQVVVSRGVSAGRFIGCLVVMVGFPCTGRNPFLGFGGPVFQHFEVAGGTLFGFCSIHRVDYACKKVRRRSRSAWLVWMVYVRDGRVVFWPSR